MPSWVAVTVAPGTGKPPKVTCPWYPLVAGTPPRHQRAKKKKETRENSQKDFTAELTEITESRRRNALGVNE